MINIHDKLDIIILAGQSNAEGNGISTSKEVEVNENALELIDANDCSVDFSDPNHVFLRGIFPVQCKIRNLQERTPDNENIRYDLSLSFVNEYIQNGFLEKDRHILVIKAAVGGTGFALKQQGLHYELYKRLIDMTEYALSLNKDNRIVAFLWHQGEHDAWENLQFNDKERYDFYHEKFMEQTLDYLNRYKRFKFPVISGEFCNEWADKIEVIKQTKVIEKCLQDCMKEIGYAGFVSSEGLKSNNQELFNGDDIHFSKNSLIELGKRYFECYKSIINN